MEANSEKLKALQMAMAKIEKDFGKGSIMKMGEENIEPTLIPAKKKMTASSFSDVSKKFPIAKNTLPTINPAIITFQRPTLSPKIPNGN